MPVPARCWPLTLCILTALSPLPSHQSSRQAVLFLAPRQLRTHTRLHCVLARYYHRRAGSQQPTHERVSPCTAVHPHVARHRRKVNCTRSWIFSASKPPRCAVCATIAPRLGNATATRQPIRGHATCANRATSSSITPQTANSYAKITTHGHTYHFSL